MARKAKNQLLSWCQRNTIEYDNVKLTDLSKSWKDGLGFCALLHHFDPNCIDFHKLKASDAEANLDLALKVAEKRFGTEMKIEFRFKRCAKPRFSSHVL